MALLTGDLSFAWTGDYDALKVFVVDDLKLNGNWEQPGGDKKVFKFNNSSIVWRKNKGFLQIEGEEVGYVMRRLCAKILSEYTNTENVNNIDVSCQTVADLECVSVESEIEELKTSQAVDREIILSLSDTVAQIAGFIKQLQEQNCSNSQIKSTPSHVQNIPNENNIKEICINKVTNGPREIDVSDAVNSNSQVKTLSQVEKISNGNNNNEIGINRVVNGSKEVMEAGDAINAFIDVNEANNLDAFEPRNCADRSNAATQSGNLANRKSTSIPKHLVPCPFLRRGHCLKGGKCDFSHNINVQQPFQFPQQRMLPLNFPQPLMNYPIYHPFLNFPYPQPLMDIPTRPFRR